jgi:hypothetical protein
MNAIDYTRKLRHIGIISMVVVAIAAAGLVYYKIVSNEDYVPFGAVLVGFIPMVLFMISSKPVCEKCGSAMEIKAGFPTIVYKCKLCGETVDTKIHSDY